jgi:hypothetical protein
MTAIRAFFRFLRRCLCVALAALCLPPLAAELPLPDVTFYGRISTRQGQPVTTGALLARVRRGGVQVLEAPGEYKSDAGAVYYVFRIPMETSIGAPGPSGFGAREGDTLNAILLSGSPLEFVGPAPGVFQAGSVTRIDAITDAAPPAPLFIRGDCNGSLKIDISDAVRVLVYLFVSGVEPPCLEACDADDTNGVVITDAIFLLDFLFNSGDSPPAPAGVCGLDAGPSPLGCTQSSCPNGV